MMIKQNKNKYLKVMLFILAPLLFFFIPFFLILRNYVHQKKGKKNLQTIQNILSKDSTKTIVLDITSDKKIQVVNDLIQKAFYKILDIQTKTIQINIINNDHDIKVTTKAVCCNFVIIEEYGLKLEIKDWKIKRLKTSLEQDEEIILSLVDEYNSHSSKLIVLNLESLRTIQSYEDFIIKKLKLELFNPFLKFELKLDSQCYSNIIKNGKTPIIFLINKGESSFHKIAGWSISNHFKSDELFFKAIVDFANKEMCNNFVIQPSDLNNNNQVIEEVHHNFVLDKKELVDKHTQKVIKILKQKIYHEFLKIVDPKDHNFIIIIKTINANRIIRGYQLVFSIVYKTFEKTIKHFVFNYKNLKLHKLTRDQIMTMPQNNGFYKIEFLDLQAIKSWPQDLSYVDWTNTKKDNSFFVGDLSNYNIHHSIFNGLALSGVTKWPLNLEGINWKNARFDQDNFTTFFQDDISLFTIKNSVLDGMNVLGVTKWPLDLSGINWKNTIFLNNINDPMIKLISPFQNDISSLKIQNAFLNDVDVLKITKWPLDLSGIDWTNVINLKKANTPFLGDISNLIIDNSNLSGVDISFVTKWPKKIESKVNWNNVICNLKTKPLAWSNKLWLMIN